MVYKTFDEIIAKLQGHAKKSRMAVAAANDDHTLGAVKQAVEAGLVEPVLVGDKKEIEKVLAEIGLTVPEEDLTDGYAVYVAVQGTYAGRLMLQEVT